MTHFFRLTILVLLLFNFSGFGCKAENSHTKSTTEHTESTTQGNLKKLMVKDSEIWVEIADSDEERMKGLMWREQMPEDQGMLFVFPHAQIQSFWMRNTYLPLDIAFIDAQWQITDIHQMEPLIDTIYYRSSVPVPYALEMNQGWFSDHQVQVGDKVSFE